MVTIKQQDLLQLLDKLKNHKSLNRTLQILLSISIFLFLFLYSSHLLTYLNSLHLLFSTYISDFFNYYNNRQFMFILCNVILVFVILNSQTSPLIHLSFFKQPINYIKRGVNMVTIKQQDFLQLLGKLKNHKSLNQTLQILLSISIFLFLFLYSARLLTYLNSLHLLFSTYISDFFFSYYNNRQFMFILCNVILVFVILNSHTSPLIHLSFFKQPINYIKRGVNMVSIKQQDLLQLLGKLKNHKSLNWTLQILLSISIFFFLFLYSSRLLTYLNSLHLLFSTYISDFFSYYNNRQFMFILCNVILVFVTEGFCLFGPFASMTVTHDLHDEFDMKKKEEEGGGEEEDGYDGGDDNEKVTGESDEKFEDFIKKTKEKMRAEALQLELLV